MSVVRDFDKLKRFNVEQLYDQYQANQRQVDTKSDEKEEVSTEVVNTATAEATQVDDGKTVQ
jgi:hypothetical protein